LKNPDLLRKIMKKLLLLNIILAALSTPLQAATVAVKTVATEILGTTYGHFSQTPDGTALGSDADIQPIVTSNPATAIYGLDNPSTEIDPETSELISKNYVTIDLGFGDKKVVTGSGVDLVIFSLWSEYNYDIGLEAYGNDGTLLSSYNYSVSPVIDPVTSYVFSTGILTTSIDLLDSNEVALGDNIELGYIRMFIGNDYNGTTGGINAYSNFSLVGAVHTVPLPLPVLLFSSGLALLGLIGRRKKV